MAFTTKIDPHREYRDAMLRRQLEENLKQRATDSKTQVLLDRDFSQQELRVLAHFEDGDMLEEYRRDPGMDLHEYAAKVINENTGLSLTRKATKNVAFSLLYGSGIGVLYTDQRLLEQDAALRQQFSTEEALANTFFDRKPKPDLRVLLCQ